MTNRIRVARDEEETEINLSPMIDCIFILLIFFIVTTVFVEEQGLQVAKPDAAASAPVQETRTIELEITADNKVLLQSKEMHLPEVAAALKASLEDPETPVVIRAHENSDHGVFVGVWDAAKRSGALTLSFNTVN